MKNVAQAFSLLVVAAAISEVEAQSDEVLTETVVEMPSGTYVHSKVKLPDGSIEARLVDSSGKSVPESVLVGRPLRRVSDRLQKAIEASPGPILVSAHLKDAAVAKAAATSGRVDLATMTSTMTVNSKAYIDGVPATPEALAADLQERDRTLAADRAARVAFREPQIAELDARESWKFDRAKIRELAERETSFAVNLTSADVLRLAEDEIIAALDLHDEPITDNIWSAFGATALACWGMLVYLAKS
jgi:hypothetical protein